MVLSYAYILAWNLVLQQTFYSTEVEVVRSNRNQTANNLSFTGYDNTDFISKSRRENKCYGDSTSDPAWSSRVSSLYSNYVTVTFDYKPSYTVSAHTVRTHKVIWRLELYAEMHQNGTGSVPNFTTWEELETWQHDPLRQETFALRGEFLYRGEEKIEIDDISEPGIFP